MRLIDADALKTVFTEKSSENVCGIELCKAIINRIDQSPTVDAIPIEYIKNQIDRWERSKFQSYHAICYRHLIEEWEMENERKEA